MFNLSRCLIIMALLLSFHSLLAQQDTGVITGQVVDESGSPIANAVVEVKNTGTGIVSQVTTGQEGSYTTQPLRIGSYTMTVEAKGFKRAIREDVPLDVQDRLRVSFTLPVGDIKQSIEVMAEISLLQSDSSSLGQVVETKKMTDLPLNGRNFIQLITLSPGAYVPQTTNSAYQGTLVSINGNRVENNNFMLDGINNNTTDNNQPPVLPTPDAIAEFKVLTNLLPAEFGRGLGGTIIVNIKSGTNGYHGTVFEFLRNQDFDANPFFNSGRPKAPYQQNQFGFSLGGPVVLPKLYNGRNKTFFFGDYQGTRIRQGLTKVFTVPTAAMRAGNFSGFGTIFDPESTQPVGNGYARTPFAGNQIPSNRFDPIMQKFLALYPLPNSGPAQFAANNFIFNPKLINDADQGDARLDHRFSLKDSLFWSFSISDNTQIAPMNLPGIPFGGYFSDLQLRPQVFRGQHMGLGETHVFGPRIVNEFRIGYNRFFYTAVALSTGVNLGTQYGIPGIPDFGDLRGLPSIGTTGLTAVGEPLTSHRGQNVRQVLDNVSFISGRHAWKFGFDHRRTEFNFRQGNSSQGAFTYSGVFTNDPNTRAGGSAFADFLLGYPGSGSVGSPLAPGSRVRNYSAFAQDDWRVSSRLTLNLGVRYEYTTPVVDVNNRLANFNLATNSIVFAQPGGIEDRSLANPDRNNFAPRIGLAYQVGSKTVVRSGYGMFYTLEDSGYSVWSNNPPFSIALALTSDQINPSTSPRPSVGFPAITAGTTLAGRFLNLNARPTNFPAAYSQQWNVSVERQLGSFLFEAAYVGNKAIKLLSILPLNNPAPGPGVINTRRPYAGWGNINYDGPFGAGMYNGLQAKVEKRLGAGLTFLASYSYAKALDDSESINLTTSAGTNQPQNPHAFRAEWSRSYNDVRQRLVASYVYALPFGKGMRWMAHTNRAVDGIAGGWQINGIWTAQSGLPFTIQSPTDTSNTGSANIRPNSTGLPGNLPAGQRSISNWLNPAAFALPTGNAYGNVGRNTATSPGLDNWDFSGFKDFKLTERPVVLQFRAELFNGLNHPNFGLPGRTFQTPQFGIISATVTNNRVVQFALKFIF